MTHYYHDQAYLRHERRKRRVKRALIIFLLLLLIPVGLFIREVIRESDQTLEPSRSTTPTKITIASSTEVYSSPYFQFQANKNWTAIANESTPTKFVYRYLRKGLVEHSLTVYVNSTPPANTATPYMYIVKQEGNRLVPVGLSKNCNTLVPAASRALTQEVTVNGARFMCNPDTVSYGVVVGIAGQSASALQLKRPDGSMTKFAIIYQNLTTILDEQQIKDVVSTFQVR